MPKYVIERDIPGAGDLTGQPAVWVGIAFVSDVSLAAAEGAYAAFAARAGMIDEPTGAVEDDLAQIAGEQGVAVRAGHHCCQPLMQHLGVAATTRASLAVYNDAADIEALLRAIDRARRLFG